MVARASLVALLAFWAPGVFASAPSPSLAVDRRGSIRVTVTGYEPGRGQLAYLLFDRKKGFPRDRAFALDGRYVEAPQTPSFVFEFADLPFGDYVVTVYQDLNANQKLDKNFLGMPREPVGASQNPRARWGPPGYEDCLFALGEGLKAIEIRLTR
mgnify:CR=1 FL=1